VKASRVASRAVVSRGVSCRGSMAAGRVYGSNWMRLGGVEAVERAARGVSVCAPCCGGGEAEADQRRGHMGRRCVKVVEAVEMINVDAVVMVDRRLFS